MANIEYTSSGSQIVVGTESNDTIHALAFSDGDGGIAFTSGSNDTLFGLGGSDTLSAGDDNDRLFGGNSNDILLGGTGDDKLFGGTGSDTLKGEDGNDTIAVEVRLSNFGVDKVSGGDGFDRLTFQTASVVQPFFSTPIASILEANRGVSVNLVNQFRPGNVGEFVLSSGDDPTDPFAFVTTIRGQIVDQSGTSSVLADIEQIDLTEFDDFILDSSASHIINAGGGNDFISGGKGFDVIDGGTGIDTALYRSSSAAVSIALLDLGSGGTGSGGDATGDKLFGIENVSGSDFNDFMLGDAKSNILRGFEGNDSLLGGSGTDTVDGGIGNDTLRGGLGNDKVIGGEGDDTALFLDWNATSHGFFTTISTSIALADGNAASSASLLSSTFRTFPVSTVSTTLETDTLTGIESVIGTNFTDFITGNSAANKLDGSAGNDVLDGGKGSDTLIGGDGIDTVCFTPGISAGFFLNTVRVEASLADGEATVFRTSRLSLTSTTTTETDSLSGIENLTGTAGADKLTGNSGVNTLDGGVNNDILEGLGGGDKLIGGDGSDTADYSLSILGVQVNLAAATAVGGDATGDTLSSIENLTGSNAADQLTGNSGVNIIKGQGDNDVIEGGASGDALDGGTGVNTLSYENSTGVAMSLDGQLLASGDAEGDSVFNFQNLSGSLSGNDTLRGNVFDNDVSGNGGDDILSGGLGGDTLNGGEGFDTADYSLELAVTIDLQAGTIAGGAAGDSFVSIEAIIGGVGDNDIRGDDQDNTFTVDAGNNQLQGRGGADTLTGGNDLDTINGGIGDDTLSGRGDDDDIQGGADRDNLSGGRGNDRLVGGQDDDTLTGNQNGDTFVFNGGNSGQDTITDWQDNVDTIEFNSGLVDSFADLTIAGNGTDHVTIIYGDNAIEIFSIEAFTLNAQDFTIL